ncbi:MAG TPA: copper resistance protein B [Luteimonas sp.]|nr:copper resistance protein B [Luteimonas sp.]
MDHSTMDHSAMEQSTPDHSEVDHAAMDHAAMGHAVPSAPSRTEHPATDHAGPNHHHPIPAHGAAALREPQAGADPREPIPPLTPADRAAAFPDLAPHAMHGTRAQWFVLVDRLEAWDTHGATDAVAEGTSWVGGDLDRLWVRSAIGVHDGRVEWTEIEALYGRAIAPWWDAVAGLRHDFGEDPSRTFAAVGLVGLAPYLYEIEATAYVGTSGQTGLGLEAERETLISNRLILQTSVEAELWGKDDAERGTGSGLSTIEAGVRLRYEFTRRFAPYLGIVRERAHGGTAELRRARDETIDDVRVVVGFRTWF